MPDEDQERFEDYIELENYVEALQAGQIARPPKNLTLERIRIYQMAALFGSTADNVAEPHPEFVEQLKTQLLTMSELPQLPPSTQHGPAPDEIHLTPEPVAVEPIVPARGTIKRARFFSRRGLLTGGALAAASLVVGAGIGYEVQKSENPQIAKTGIPPNTRPVSKKQHLQLPTETPTTWQMVTTLADLGNEAVRFTSNTLVGYVIRTTNVGSDASGNTDNVIALSGACTHMGCLVQWKSTEHHFVCPCHGALFSTQGAQISTNYKHRLPSLPSLNTKIEDGKVYVEVPL